MAPTKTGPAGQQRKRQPPKKRKAKATKDSDKDQKEEPQKKKARKGGNPKAKEGEALAEQAEPAAPLPSQNTGPSGIGVSTTAPPGGWSAARFIGHGVWKVRGQHMFAKPYHDGNTIKTEWTPVD